MKRTAIGLGIAMSALWLAVGATTGIYNPATVFTKLSELTDDVGFFHKDGSVAMTGDINTGGNSITNVQDFDVLGDMSIISNISIGTGLVIGDTVVDAGYIADLDGDIIIKGSVNMNAGSITNVADPVNAQDVATKAYGDANWASSGSSTDVLFYVYATNDQSIGASTSAKIDIDAELYDTGDDYDLAGNNRFDVPENGFYRFVVEGFFGAKSASTHQFTPALYTNGALAVRGQDWDGVTSGEGGGGTVNVVLQLASGDYVEAYVINTDSDTSADLPSAGAQDVRFLGWKMQ